MPLDPGDGLLPTLSCLFMALVDQHGHCKGVPLEAVPEPLFRGVRLLFMPQLNDAWSRSHPDQFVDEESLPFFFFFFLAAGSRPTGKTLYSYMFDLSSP